MVIDPPVLRAPEGADAPRTGADTRPGEEPVVEALTAASEFLTAASNVCDRHEPMPISLLLWVSNPEDVAVQEKGELKVELGHARAFLGMGDSVDSLAYDGVVAGTQAEFTALGIDATVSRQRRTLGQTVAHSWSQGHPSRSDAVRALTS